ncbi:Uncharacterised protein [Klebsiella quasipneumoniae]|uniref:Uncharacterized protein n=1 Tax=Klebsiella quasipneumoniae TaxID=1463165 RepID=A0ABD7N7F0_9ENTR|nr:MULTISPECIES: hypothetical protein [Klebsiella]HDW0805861.1 hypothetical protein [Escherichia coli]MBD7491582.1 hypothetical protein [Klebsiella pneumoniae]MBT0601781.1 hypothetical protein [Klebsiella quasipneumoniae]MDG0018966.1 hypothetical protein [Klebsiella pneumoniae]MDX7657926.1 hypothetical protein [Klebsiella quasipneumoniae]
MSKKEDHGSIKIPPMEYFTLDRAASILQCDTDDLLHYGVIGAIPLCVMMRGFPSALIFVGGKDIQDPIEFYNEHKGNSSFLFRENNYISEFNSVLTEHDVYKTDGGFILFRGLAHGLWCLGHGEIESLLYSKRATVIDTTIFRPFGWDTFREKTGLSCHIISDRYFNQSWLPTLNRQLAKSAGFQLRESRKPAINEILTTSDLFIARDTILKLKDAIDTGEPIKSMINGGVIPLPPTEMNVGKPVKTTEKQMRLIVALLKRIGLTDSDLKGSITQLRNKANNKGEELPLPDDDKTLIDWLRKGGVNR